MLFTPVMGGHIGEQIRPKKFDTDWIIALHYVNTIITVQ